MWGSTWSDAIQAPHKLSFVIAACYSVSNVVMSLLPEFLFLCTHYRAVFRSSGIGHGPNAAEVSDEVLAARSYCAALVSHMDRCHGYYLRKTTWTLMAMQKLLPSIWSLYPAKVLTFLWRIASSGLDWRCSVS